MKKYKYYIYVRNHTLAKLECGCTSPEYDIVKAETLEEAWKVYQNYKPDAVILKSIEVNLEVKDLGV